MITMSLLDVTIKVSLIVLVALAATMLLRTRSAAVRHWVLSAALLCAAATPVLQLIVPTWQLSLVPWSSAQPIGEREGPFAIREAPRPEPATSGPDERPASEQASIVHRVLGWSWMVGTAISLLILFIGLGRLAWLASRAEPVLHGTWNELAEEIARAYGVRRRLLILQSDHPTLLVTWGLVRPKVILPRAARAWTEDRARVVLCHELAHIQRRDWVLQLAAELLRSVYWFNPLLWIACRRLRQDSEQACDDAVLKLGIEGSEYATHLLDLARAFGHDRRTWLPAPAIARPSSLERRIRAMLNTRVNRAPTTRSSRLTTIAASMVLAMAVASAQGAFSTFSGTVFDPSNGFLPDVRMILTHTQSQAKHEIRSDRTGRFEFVGLPPGEYSLETIMAGFAPLRGTLTLSGGNVQRDLTLKIGSLRETITLRAGRQVSDSGDAAQTMVKRPLPPSFQKSPCPSGPASAGGGMGGNIRAPMKLVDVKPRYPVNLSAAGTGGVVVLEARIGTDGMIRDLETISATHPDLDYATRDAVRQWEFSQTLLNCVPIEVNMTVTANFVVEQ